MELLKVDTLEQAREKLMQAVGDGWQRVCEVPLPDALEKVLAEDVYGALDIPGFRRSMVDGYAVQSKDTMGAGTGEHLKEIRKTRGLTLDNVSEMTDVSKPMSGQISNGLKMRCVRFTT